MKGLIFAGIYEGKGSGHVARMAYLIDYILENVKWDVDFFTNDNEKSTSFLNKINYNIKPVDDPQEEYDFILIDSPNLEMSNVKKLRTKTKLLIRLDSLYCQSNVDVVVNLFNHNKPELKDCQLSNLEGLQYSIIKKNILNSKREIAKATKVLVTFGGEDPNSNSRKTLDFLQKKEVEITLIAGPLNKDIDYLMSHQNDRTKVIQSTNEMGLLMATNDIVICGSGTTLLEAICIGNPIIVLPQNEAEISFLHYVNSFIRLFNFEDMDDLLVQIKDEKFRDDLKKSYNQLIDGKGCERIVEIIKSQL